MAMRLLATLALTLGALSIWAADAPGPLSPREELATFRVPKGFKVELVAAEPDIVDPVAMAFDENGRIYVAEMHGYPNGGIATGKIGSGKIKLLTPDSDGVYRKATTFAEGLRLPTSVMPWKGGLLVANCPDLIYLEDTDGDGKADKSRVLYTGFDLANIQQLLSSLQWGMDNWVYGCAGGKGGDIHSAEKPDAPVVTLRGRGVRLHPDVPASLEPTSGGGQYGLAPDDWMNWFTATNSQHLRQIVLPDQYLRRNPYLPVSQVTLDIPDHGAACQVFRVSPFEAWRVERTTRRKTGAGAKGFSPTELVPGGFITSGCSPIVYTAYLFPADYRGNTFVCDPANNLIHRDVLVANGASFIAKRADEGCEFLASTDNWCRPVWLTLGPDGAIYVLDFYREVIETPLSLPDDIKQKLNLESRGRGRIWRITTESAPKPVQPALGKATTAELVQQLANPNSWWRLTAQRLLIERQDQAAVPNLEKLAQSAKLPVGRAHALWSLHGLKGLKDELIQAGLKDDHPGVRAQALKLAEERLAKSPTLLQEAIKLTDDPSPQVRYQLAFSLGSANGKEPARALAKLLARADSDSWTQTAVLSSASQSADALLEALTADPGFRKDWSASKRQVVVRLAAIVGARGNDAEVGQALRLLGEGEVADWQVAVLEGLGQGMQSSQRSLARLWETPPADLKTSVERAIPIFRRAAVQATDEKRPVAERLAAVRLAGFGPFAVIEQSLPTLLTPAQPAEVQLAAVRALAIHDQAKVADLLLAGWNSYSPSVRGEVLEAVLARPDRLKKLLDAIEAKKFPAAQIDLQRVERLRKHPDAALRQRATALLADRATPDRKKIIEEYRPALDLAGDAARGKALFKKNCAVCHRLENEGVEVGADLLAALPNKTPEALLIDILDPSREVDPRYINYVLTTKGGQILTGMVAVETPASITLRRAEKAEDTILRSQIEDVQATTKSLMPEELEKQLAKQDLADVIAYLLSVVMKK